MTVKINVSIASATYSYRPNEVVELDDATATKWIANGICDAVPTPKKTNKKGQ